MKKQLIVIVLGVLIALILVGCGGEAETEGEEEAQAEEQTQGTEEADAASRPTEIWIEEPSDVQSALGPDGAWIILFDSNVTVDEEVSVSGEVYQEEGAEEPRRKIALYAQDSDRNVTDRY
ncbi:MAG: hypothetical protein ACOC2N_06305, partial [Spirochaetota bacterium]